MTDKNHVHKLKKHIHKSGHVILFCTLPDCTYKINAALALGKRCICWRCGKEFILSEYALRLVKPHCESCHKPKKEFAILEAPESNNTIESNKFEAPASEELDFAEKLEKEFHEVQEDLEHDI